MRSPIRKFTSEQTTTLSKFAGSAGIPTRPTSHAISTMLPTSETAPLPRWNATKRVATLRMSCAMRVRSAQV